MTASRTVLSSVSLIVQDSEAGQACISVLGADLRVGVFISPGQQVEPGQGMSATAQVFKDDTLSLSFGGNFTGAADRVAESNSTFASIRGIPVYWQAAVQRVGSKSLVTVMIYKLTA